MIDLKMPWKSNRSSQNLSIWMAGNPAACLTKPNQISSSANSILSLNDHQALTYGAATREALTVTL